MPPHGDVSLNALGVIDIADEPETGTTIARCSTGPPRALRPLCGETPTQEDAMKKYQKPQVVKSLSELDVFGAEDLMTSAWSNTWSNKWNNHPS